MGVKAYFHITANGKDITDRVESFDYEMSNEKDNLLTIKVLPAKSLVTIDDDDVSVGNSIEFFWGWVGGAVSQKQISKISDIEVDYQMNKTTMSIKCLDKGNRSKKTSNTKIWKKMRLSEIVQSIAISNNLQSSVQVTNKIWDSVPQANRSDFELIQYLARRESPGNWICYFNGETIILEQRDIARKAKYYFEWGDPRSKLMSIKAAYRESNQDASLSGADYKTFDPKTLESGKVEKKNVDANTGAYSFSQNGKEVKNNEGTSVYVPTNFKVPQTSDIGTQNGVVPMKASLKKKGQVRSLESLYGPDYKKPPFDPSKVSVKSLPMDDKGGFVRPPQKVISSTKMREEAKVKSAGVTPGDKDEAQAKANSIASASSLKVLEIDVTMMGDPNFHPNDLFTLAGVAKRHGGNWYMKTVTHSIKRAGDYTCVLKGSKNATSKPMGSDDAKKKDVNDSVGDNDKKVVEVIKYDENAKNPYGYKGKFAPGGSFNPPMNSDIASQNGVRPPVLKSNIRRGARGSW